MDPSIWGPHLWYVMHIISFSYPREPSEYDKRAYHDFYQSLKDVIPCDVCKKHYSKYITEYPISPHLDNKETLIKWVIQVHNFVNISTGKPTYTPVEVLQLYANLTPVSPFYNLDEREIIQKRKNETNYTLMFSLLLLSALTIIFLKYSFQKNYYYN
jgi:hypothetical protein